MAESAIVNAIKQLNCGMEYNVKYKGSATPLTLLKTKNEYMLHGFFDNDDKDINELVENFVYDKAKGEVVHYSTSENYCSIIFGGCEVVDLQNTNLFKQCV